MEDISLHVLDIAENAVRADASLITINIARDRMHDRLSVSVVDDGRGMDAETLARVRDPFFTTKKKKTGLGIPLLAQAAEQCGGSVSVESSPGYGTRIVARFSWSSIDRPSIGDMAATILTLITGHADIDIVFSEHDGECGFRFDTREIKQDIEGIPINDPSVLAAIKGLLDAEMFIR